SRGRPLTLSIEAFCHGEPSSVEEDDGRDVQPPSAGDRLHDALETMVEADLGGTARGPATRDPLPSPLPSSCPAWPVAAAARWKLRSPVPWTWSRTSRRRR